MRILAQSTARGNVHTPSTTDGPAYTSWLGDQRSYDLTDADDAIRVADDLYIFVLFARDVAGTLWHRETLAVAHALARHGRAAYESMYARLRAARVPGVVRWDAEIRRRARTVGR